jgi:hypothetical protein
VKFVKASGFAIASPTVGAKNTEAGLDRRAASRLDVPVERNGRKGRPNWRHRLVWCIDAAVAWMNDIG